MNHASRWRIGFLSLLMSVGLPVALAATESVFAAQNADGSPKAPVPDMDRQREAEKTIKEVFKQEYAKKSRDEKRAFSQQLLQQGIETKNDATSQYVLLREAISMAVQAGDAQVAWKAINELDGKYHVDALVLKLETLGKIAGTATAADDNKELAKTYLMFFDEVAAADRYEIATRAILLAESSARKAKDVSLLSTIRSRGKELRDQQAEFTAVKAAKEKLAANPDDPASNLSVGKFYCFSKGDWNTGLPFLAKGGDATLKALIDKEAAPPSTPEEKSKVADEWWAIAEKLTPGPRLQVQRRAVKWYEDALPGLTGLAKVKAEARIDSDDFWKPAQWITDDSREYAAPTSYVSKVALADLVSPSPTAQAFSSTRETPYVVIDLQGLKRLTGFEIRNVKGLEQRAKTMTIWVGDTADGSWTEIWRCKAAEIEWKIDLTKPAKARFLKIGNRENEHFHLNALKIKGQERL